MTLTKQQNLEGKIKSLPKPQHRHERECFRFIRHEDIGSKIHFDLECRKPLLALKNNEINWKIFGEKNIQLKLPLNLSFFNYHTKLRDELILSLKSKL